MSTTHLAAIDLGATSGRVIVGSYSKDGLALNEIHRFPNAYHRLGTNYYWDLGGFFTEIERGLLLAKEQFPDLASCGVDCWGVDCVLTDRNGRLVFPAHSYRDERTEPLLKSIKDSGEDRQLFAWTGIPAINYNTALQLAETIESFPEITGLAQRCLWLPDYFNFLLSGRMENELSVASTSQMLDIRDHDFHQETLARFRIPEHWLSRPAKAGIKMGRVENIESLSDLEVILVPGHDTSCAFEAVPRAGKDIIVSAGTWLLIGSIIDAPLLSDDAFEFGISNERAGNGAYRPNKIIAGLFLLEQILSSFTDRPRNDREWVQLIDSASAQTASGHFIDITDSRLFNPSGMREAIDQQLTERGIAAPHGLSGYVRLICDSLGKEVADAVKRFQRNSGITFERIQIVGGGSRNTLFCQRVADLSGLPAVSLNLEATSAGNIAYQLLGLGIIGNLNEFHAVLRNGLKQQTFEPR